ncbi:hypothetical protein Poli38472_000909 [Pythium oligandrum]|uniref:Uncharacterized protein n=1 Tax=Pythium oligandrum TaxID=41045 RepID=A0A8K1CEQ5_PYTOL|nr:hypothetical protein Poli38472_000909 [Pythium oligandrum]|eukprot:TMW60867.1 hypothetical protein Poli38472_000909 [Pythium oligandrum]
MERKDRQNDGYAGQYLARNPPPPPHPLPPVASRPVRKMTKGLIAPSKAFSASNKSLVDAFKQHGMKLCDGAKLNVVGKSLTTIGLIPPSLGVHVTSVYLSQNDLRSLAGLEQFQSVRLLSIGGNLLTRFSDVERLKGLKHLRHLNLTGNPICSLPNYRTRVVDLLEQIQVLDAVDITRRDREGASVVATQDKAFRDMLFKNHMEIHKRQRISTWILVLQEFHTLVLSDAVSGRFDQLPTPLETTLDVDRFVRLWRYEEVFNVYQREDLELQMAMIVVRTHVRLADHPKVRAKEMLLKLANAPASRAKPSRLTKLPAEGQEQHVAWEEAYASVLQLQQQTLISIQSDCERNVRGMVESLRRLLVTNPFQRKQAARLQSQVTRDAVRPSHGGEERSHSQSPDVKMSRMEPVVTQSMLPPQQCDPDLSSPSPDAQPSQALRKIPAKPSPHPLTGPHARTTQLRSGQFGNKSLQEAVQAFKLRDSKPPMPRSNQMMAKPKVIQRTVRSVSALVQSDDCSSGDHNLETLVPPRPVSFMQVPSESKSFLYRDASLRLSSNFLEDESDMHSESVVSNTVVSAESKYAPSIPEDHQNSRFDRRLSSRRESSSQLEYGEAFQSRRTQEHVQDAPEKDDVRSRMQHTGVQPLTSATGDYDPSLKERQQELEEREAKYIKALMESEQRELDLRQQLQSLQREMVKSQRSLSESAEERKQIKHEVEERVRAIAAPVILRRFFSKWMEFLSLRLQVEQLRRRRCFVTQHDALWDWRRKVWVQQQLRRQRRRNLMKRTRQHFVEWANLTRITVIAVHTQALRHRQLLKRIVAEWRQQAHVSICMRLLSSKATTSIPQLRQHFLGWKLAVQHRRQLQRAQLLHQRTKLHAAKRLVFGYWKIFVQSTARMTRLAIHDLARRVKARTRKMHLRAWWHVTLSSRLYRTQSTRRVWRGWTSRLKADRSIMEERVMIRRRIIKVHFMEWHTTAEELVTRRRAFSLASRHLSHRRLRKLWMHWKIYSISRKRHVQGSTKALKHYFTKMLRSAWRGWARQTRQNLLMMKENKRGEMRRHFTAFRVAVQIQRQGKQQERWIRHMQKRQACRTVREQFQKWQEFVIAKRRTTMYANVLKLQRQKNLLSYVWCQWRTRRFDELHRRLQRATHECTKTVSARQAVEEELLQQNERAISLAEQLSGQKKTQEMQSQELIACQQRLSDREYEVTRLKTDLSTVREAQMRLVAERHEDESARIKNEQLLRDENIRLAEENCSQRTRMSDLEGKLRETEDKSTGFRQRIEELETKLEEGGRQWKQSRQQLEKNVREMQNEISDLTSRLEAEHKQREETANRLQEYEQRIASTCAEINQHESAHEQECIQLRAEYAHMESLWKQETARNSELQHLLQEKNSKIVALTLQVHSQGTNEGLFKAQTAVSSVADVDPSKSARDCDKEPTVTSPCPRDRVSRVLDVGTQSSPVIQPSKDLTNGDRIYSVVEPTPEECVIDTRASKIREDIRLLQDRIVSRLQQSPCVPSLGDFTHCGLIDAERTRERLESMDPPSSQEARSETSEVIAEDLPSEETKTASSPDAKKKSPSKANGKQHFDPQSSLAAISARLTPYITPAELEIARINALVAKQRPSSPEKNASSDGEGSSSTAAADGADGRAPDSPGKRASAVVSTLTAAIKSTGGTNSALHDSMIAEEWVNVHLETSGAYLLPASDIQALLNSPDLRRPLADDAMDEETFAYRKGGDGGPLARAGIDRWTLYRLGMPKELVDRLYRALYVYTNGFHNIILEIASRCPPSVEKHVSSNVWLTFLLLLEQCENGKYEMAMLKFKQATEEWRQQMQNAFTDEKLKLRSHIQSIESQLHDEMTRSSEKSRLIDKLVDDATVTSATVAALEHEDADKAEQLRLLKLDILVHEEAEKQLNEQIDEAKKDYEIANSERFNALTERYALDDEIRKLQGEMERLEVEKTNYGKRMHETLFMNQALRATNETLKQNIVVINVEKDKLEKDKQGVQEHVESLQHEMQELKLSKAAVEHELMESERCRAHLEERLSALKVQLDAEMEHNSRQVREIAHLASLVDEEKVKVGVLEAKCNLLTAEKQNTGMRAQDKLRIERLLNQKLELENHIETLKLERTKDQEQIWNLRASLEALDSELQHTKRVFSAGQQAFLHSERSAEQLRHQLQEMEKNYEKASKNLASLRERFKMFEESSKEQVTKLEVELKVTGAQLREVTYVNRDNAAMIADLTKSLETSEKDSKSLKTRLEASEKQYEQLVNEKEDLQRDQKERDLQNSSSKQTIRKFLRELQEMLALVKVDEFPLDDAIRELIRMVRDTFGSELDPLAKFLDDEDEPLDFVEEYDPEELKEVERERKSRLSSRRQGFSMGPGADGDAEGEAVGDGDLLDRLGDSGEVEYDDKRRTTAVARMSKFRRSKLETLVTKLQRDVELKTDLVRSLEDVICTQADEVTVLTSTNEQQLRWLKLNENQKGMLRADVDGLLLCLKEVRGQKAKVELALEEAKIALVMESNKTFQTEVLLQTLRRKYDMQCASTEDLLSKIGRAYEHELFMRSLRREKAVQATVVMATQFTQTLVPQRNPALERVRMAAMNLPALNPMSVAAESVLQQINDATKALLPGVTKHSELQLTMEENMRLQARMVPQQPSLPGARPTMRNPRQMGRHTQHQHRHLQPQRVNRGTDSSVADVPPPQVIHHVNEFGTRQDVLISPVYPPYFDGHGSPTPQRLSSVPVPGSDLVQRSSRGMPRKPPRQRPWAESPASQQQIDARVDSPRGSVRSSYGEVRSEDVDHPTGGFSPPNALRYHRGFLRTGLEVLRNAGRKETEDERGGEFDYDYEGYEDHPGDHEVDGDSRYTHGPWRSSTSSLHSPSKLELAVRDFQSEQSTRTSPTSSPSRYYSHRLKDTEYRSAEILGLDEFDTEMDNDELTNDARESRFVPGVLYPILPPR